MLKLWCAISIIRSTLFAAALVVGTVVHVSWYCKKGAVK